MSEQQTVTAAKGSIKVEQTLEMTVTDLAKEKLGLFLGADKRLDDHGIRISVQPGGCSGAQYGMSFATAPEGNEMELVANGVRLFVLPEYAMVLNGVEVDFLDEMMGGGFKIHNPNATNSCGCGKSFSA